MLFTDGRPNPDLLKKKRRNKSKDQTKPANDISRILKEEKNITIVGLAGGTEQNIAQFRDYINTWASPKLVFESKLGELDNVIDKLIAASCKVGKQFYTLSAFFLFKMEINSVLHIGFVHNNVRTLL